MIVWLEPFIAGVAPNLDPVKFSDLVGRMIEDSGILICGCEVRPLGGAFGRNTFRLEYRATNPAVLNSKAYETCTFADIIMALDSKAETIPTCRTVPACTHRSRETTRSD